MIRYILQRKNPEEDEWNMNTDISGKGPVLNIRLVRLVLEDLPMDLIQIRDITMETRMHEEIHRLADIVKTHRLVSWPDHTCP